jgi:hypothetical protein
MKMGTRSGILAYDHEDGGKEEGLQAQFMTLPPLLDERVPNARVFVGAVRVGPGRSG